MWVNLYKRPQVRLTMFVRNHARLFSENVNSLDAITNYNSSVMRDLSCSLHMIYEQIDCRATAIDVCLFAIMW